MDIIQDQTHLAIIEEMLQNHFNLPVGHHLQIENVFSEKHSHSELIHFSVIWPSDTVQPSKLILKINNNTGREVSFYRAVVATENLHSLTICLGSEYDPAAGLSKILLEDLTLTHSEVGDWPNPLPLQAGFDLVEALASLHSTFWMRPLQGDPTAVLPDFLQDESLYLSHVGYLRRDFEIYAASMGDSLDCYQCQIYPEVLSLLPGLWSSFWKPRLAKGPLPLIHGDLNPRNILYPNHTRGKVILIDWEAHRLGLPSDDLAMLLGLHLCPEFEDALPFLRHYHERIIQAGIKDYSFDDFLTEYEISLVFILFFPLKLYAQAGIQDECLIQNSIQALNSLRETRF